VWCVKETVSVWRALARVREREREGFGTSATGQREKKGRKHELIVLNLLTGMAIGMVVGLLAALVAAVFIYLKSKATKSESASTVAVVTDASGEGPFDATHGDLVRKWSRIS